MSQPRPDLEDFDRDAEVSSEARVVNVTDEVQRFEIATQAGSTPRRYKLTPHGTAGAGVHVQAGYTVPYKGVGRGMIAPTIETMTEREVYPAGPLGPPGLDGISRPTYPAGPRLPCVVSETRAPAARKAWQDALAARPRGAASRTIVLQTAAGERIDAVLAPQRPAAPAQADDEDEDLEDMTPPDGELPDLPEVPEPVTAPAAKRKARG